MRTERIIFKGDSAVYRVAAGYNTPREFEEYSKENPIVPGRGTITGRAVLEGKTVHIPDVLADPEYTGTGYQTRGEYRSSLAVPLLREGETIGVFTLMRLAVRPYTEKQIELVTTFADQAVIAIENVRLFEEVQARTSELAQSVGELRALGEVTQAVNSTVDLETVLTTIVAKATQLSSTEAGAIYVFDDADQEFQTAGDLWNGRKDHRRDQGSSHAHRRDCDWQGCRTTHAGPDCGSSERSVIARP